MRFPEGKYLTEGSYTFYVHKVFQKTVISYTLVCKYAYQGVRNVPFWETIDCAKNKVFH